MEWITDPQSWIALLTLTALEIVLGIDNIIFISILADKLPQHQQNRARVLGLALAMITRIALLFSLSLIMRLTAPWFTLLGQEISGRDLILISGGLFLLAKSTIEIHGKIEGAEDAHGRPVRTYSFAGILVQIAVMDLIFSLDSVITAVGMVNNLVIMVIAIVVAVVFMMLFVNAVARFVDRRPTIKMLALSFLLLIGVALVAEGLDLHLPRGYIYFAMAFSAFVEILNQKIRPKTVPVGLPRPARKVPESD
jgi:predicted tellurium resistance membrane protein TerC